LAEGIDSEFVQDNLSMSREIGTVRGLHCQRPPHAQAKFVRCARGRLFDVAVDVRKGSPDFGRWFAEELSFENGRQLFIPAGFLHGFITLEPNTEIIYKCSDFYAPDSDISVRFDDPDIAIDWPIKTQNAILSSKDAFAVSWAEFDSQFIYEGG
jgi:dTDP-4-dehydrorhamnose 3,5-epimerase